MRFPIPGGVYGFALPDRTYGATMEGGYITTSEGRVELPGEGIARLDGVRWHGQLYLAGEGGQSGHAWLYKWGKWKEFGPTHGVNCCAFGDGVLYVAISGDEYLEVNLDTLLATTRPLALGSQGIRYVNEANVPVAGDATLGFNPAEYTTRGDVTVGQGHDSGTLINGRVLEPGESFFPKFKRDGDKLAVYIVKFAEHQGVIHWITRAEVDTFLLPGVVDLPPVVKPMSLPNILASVQAVRATSPARISPTQAVEALNTIALKNPGFGLLAKPNGNHGAQPKTGIFCSCDWLVHKPSGLGLDAFTAGPDSTTDPIELGLATPQWGAGETFDQSRFVAPVDFVVGNAGDTGGTIPPIPATGSAPRDFAAYVEAMQKQIVVLSKVCELLTNQVQALLARPSELGGGIDGKRIALRTDNGHYLTAENGGGGAVVATRTEAGGWETFTVEAK